MKNFQFSYCGFKVYEENGALVAHENGEPFVAVMGDPDKAARMMLTMLCAVYVERQNSLDVSSEGR